jgi:hypothetical protein
MSSMTGFYRAFRALTPNSFYKWIDRYNFEGQEIQDLTQSNPMPIYVQTIDLSVAQTVASPLLVNIPGRGFNIYGFTTGTATKSQQTNVFVNVRLIDDKIENQFPAKHNRGYRGDFTKLYLNWPAQGASSIDLIIFKFDDDPWQMDSLNAAQVPVNLATQVTGVLPVANGGTNSSTALANNRVMISSAGKIIENAALAVSSPVRSDVNGLPTTGSTSLTTEVTGVLPVANGGTNSGAALANGLMMVSSGGKVIEVAADTSMGSNKITSVKDPTLLQDAATKNYVDNGLAQLNPLAATYAASTANIVGTYFNGVAGIGATFTVTAFGVFAIDGVSPPILSRILLKDQTTGFQRGVYDLTVVGTVGTSAVLTRSLDYDSASDMNAGNIIPVINGTANALTSWVQTATITTVGVDTLTFTQWTQNPANFLLKANNLSDVTTKATAFNNISPMTTGGDLIYGGAAGIGTRLANGTAGQLLQSNGGTTAPTWTSVPTNYATYLYTDQAGYGGTDTFVVYFTNNRLAVDATALLTIVNNNTNGLRITANRRCDISITISYVFTAGDNGGISKNAGNASAALSSINDAQIAMQWTTPGNQEAGAGTLRDIAAANDIYRAQTDGGPAATNHTFARCYITAREF